MGKQGSDIVDFISSDGDVRLNLKEVEEKYGMSVEEASSKISKWTSGHLHETSTRESNSRDCSSVEAISP